MGIANNEFRIRARKISVLILLVVVSLQSSVNEFEMTDQIVRMTGYSSENIQCSWDREHAFEGFGRNATGGNQEQGRLVTVTSFEDNGPGTLRQLFSDATGPIIVEFAENGTIRLNSTLDVPSNVTIDGKGQNITITGNGFRIKGQSNVIIQNLAFRDVGGQTGDGIQIMDESHDIVIDHCLFDNRNLTPKDYDEQISIIFGSHDITISWCKFDYHEKVMLIGNGDADASIDSKITVTLHHNHFHKTGRRHPFLRYGKVDMYNNFIQEWHRYQGLNEDSYGVRCAENGQILMESNRFEQYNWLNLKAAHVLSGGRIQSVNNSTKGIGMTLENNGPVFARPYKARIDRITQDWLQMMKNSTGNTL